MRSALVWVQGPPERKNKTPCCIDLRQGVIFMAETYDITHEGAPVGSAQMEKQGLYYVFSCRCRLPDKGMYRIHVICGETREDLGICIPIDGMFGTEKRIPSKRLGEKTPAFELVAKDWVPPTPAMPEPEEPPLEEEKQSIPEPEEPVFHEEAQFTPESVEDTFIPVSEEEPFEHLDKLENAVMEIRGDTPGVIIADEKLS